MVNRIKRKYFLDSIDVRKRECANRNLRLNTSKMLDSRTGLRKLVVVKNLSYTNNFIPAKLYTMLKSSKSLVCFRFVETNIKYTDLLKRLDIDAIKLLRIRSFEYKRFHANYGAQFSDLTDYFADGSTYIISFDSDLEFIAFLRKCVLLEEGSDKEALFFNLLYARDGVVGYDLSGKSDTSAFNVRDVLKNWESKDLILRDIVKNLSIPSSALPDLLLVDLHGVLAAKKIPIDLPIIIGLKT